MTEVEDVRGLTQVAFTRLLEWLDDGDDSQGARYLDIRRRLVTYFDRRNRPHADELADDTLTRIGRTLEASGRIVVTPPARYCYVVARFVLLEDIRRARRSVPIDEARVVDRTASADAERQIEPREQRLACLERCLDQLKPEQRQLAIDYYRDVKRAKIERRRSLARQLGISMNALGIRACRIRASLEICVNACCAAR
jgi:DNA-directed RNA polymerase specialized sigma24 family protein